MKACQAVTRGAGKAFPGRWDLERSGALWSGCRVTRLHPVLFRLFSEGDKPDRKRKKKNPDEKEPEKNENGHFEEVKRRLKQLKELMKSQVITLSVLGVVGLWLVSSFSTPITFDEAIHMIREGDFNSLVIDERRNGELTVKVLLTFSTDRGRLWTECLDSNIVFEHLADLKTKRNRAGQTPTYKVVSHLTTQELLDGTASTLALVSLLVFVIMSLSGRNKANTEAMIGREERLFTKFVPKRFDKNTAVKTKFSDVAGIQQTKQEIEEFVDFLRNPEKYKAVGAKLPKGALLSGPPGTGKTLLAKAVAGEAQVPFFFASGSEFVEMYVGLGAKRVRELFEEAKKHPAAIIFIDEIDSIGKKRSGKLSGNSESDATLNQLLVEMDGFKTSTNVVVFAATNRKDLLDPALVRPGRFDRTIEINLPDISARAEIFGIHLKPLKLPEGADREQIARRLAALSPGFSGADIANICNEAAIHAVRRGLQVVENYDFEMAVERVIGGMPVTRQVSDRERRTVAVHESGHGVVSWFLKGAAPLLKLTIIPRSKGALGFAQYLPNEIPLQSEEFLRNQIIAVLAGRAAEFEFFGKTSTGASDDLQKAYRIARAIVTRLGMNPEIGQAVFSENEYGVKEYSDGMNRKIDEEVTKIIRSCSQTAAAMAKEHRDLIQKMSDALLEKETLDLKAIKAILGDRPFPPESVFKAYLEEATAV